MCRTTTNIPVGMKKILIVLAMAVVALLPNVAKAQTASPGEWRLHNSYHNMPYSFRFDKKIVDTPNKVYMLSLGIAYFSWSASFGIEYPFLFVYDKKEDMIEGYNAKNYLHGNIIRDMWYNATKKYFLIVYEDYNIDILYTEDDRCYAVPGLASAEILGSKDINSVTFDAENDRAYVATVFGYLVIDDSKNVITESHVYNVSINGIARVGDMLVAGNDDGIFTSPVESNTLHNSWDTFTKVADTPTNVKNILPLKNKTFLYTSNSILYKGLISDQLECIFDKKDLLGTKATNFSEINDGYFFNTEWEGALVNREGVVTKLSGSSSFRNATYGASSKDVVWKTAAPNGITKLKYNGSAWVNEPSPSYGEFIKPNVPAVFDAGMLSFSTKYGMITTNIVYTHFHGDTSVGYDFIVSKYKNGIWTNEMPSSTSAGASYMVNTHSGKMDFQDEDILWAGSATAGIVRYNLENKKSARFMPSGSGNANCVSPKFDKDGTLWTIRSNPGSLCYWPKEARLKEDGSKFKAIPVAGFAAGAFPVFVPCTSESTSNIVVFAKGTYAPGLDIYDHNGTLDNTADDRHLHFDNLIDQDGLSVNLNYVYCMDEDSEGRVWVGGDGGVYWFYPQNVFNSDFHVNRVKVARNDGTNLADYLLEGSSVFALGIDGAGHKWFGTLGNGVVETSANGSEIIRQLTFENSYLPCNDVISFGFEPDSNCVWIGTKQGMAQYYSETAPGAESLDNVLAYPNPVRPDYYGYVTVKGLMDGSLVKILDAQGGLVRELGRSEGGMMLWDLTNMGGRRVPTGVYYVVSSTSGDSSEANVAKIMVLN